MSRTNASRSNLFLMELMIAILFFSLGSAVCIQIFAKAHMVDQSARDLSFASAQVSSAASVIKYTENELLALKEFYPDITESGNGFMICYDKNYNEVSPSDAVYTLEIIPGNSNGMETAHIQMTKKNSSAPIYQLDLRYPANLSRKD